MSKRDAQVALRQILLHAVDFDILWAIVNRDLPILIAQIESILQGDTHD